MKKVIKIVSAIALSLCLLVCATGCVSNNWGRAKEKLEAEGYKVTATVNTGELDDKFVIGSALTACTGKVAEETDPISSYVYGSKDGKFVHIFYCESGEIATELVEAIEANKANLIKNNEMEEKEAKIGKFGKVVYFGHKEAVKAA